MLNLKELPPEPLMKTWLVPLELNLKDDALVPAIDSEPTAA